MKYFIETYGCQMNVHDSERMAGLLEQAGYEATPRAARRRCGRHQHLQRARARRREALHAPRRDSPGQRRDRPHARRRGGRLRGAAGRPARMLKRSNLIDVIVGTQSLKQLPALVGAGDAPIATRPRRASTSTRTRTCRFRSAWRGGTIRSRRTSPSSKAATSSARSASCPTRAATSACARGATSSTKWCRRRGRGTARSSCSGRSSITIRRRTIRRATLRRCSRPCTRCLASSGSGLRARIRGTCRCA